MIEHQTTNPNCCGCGCGQCADNHDILIRNMRGQLWHVDRFHMSMQVAPRIQHHSTPTLNRANLMVQLALAGV